MKRRIVGSDEQDVHTGWRRYYVYTQRAGVCKKIRRATNRRERREGRAETAASAEAGTFEGPPGAIPFAEWTVVPRVCQECAVDHSPDLPHDPESLYYRHRFRINEALAGRQERWPTWSDAIAHCPADIKALWSARLSLPDTEDR